jgi:hypothetical protein
VEAQPEPIDPPRRAGSILADIGRIAGSFTTHSDSPNADLPMEFMPA